MWLCQKPLLQLYQEILDQVYIMSKSKQIFIRGPYLTNIFNTDDLNGSGQISTKAFVQRIKQELLVRMESKMSDALIVKELEFLATKYGRDQVDY